MRPSTWASFISTWQTIMGGRRARPNRLSDPSCDSCRAKRSLFRRKLVFLCGPGRLDRVVRASHCSRASINLCSVLGLDHVDIFYAHRFDAETPLEETLGALNDIVRRGKAVYAGLSNYSGGQFNEAIELARQRNYGPIVVEQSSYSIFNRQIEGELLPSVARAGLGMIAFSPLAQGLLSEKYLGGIPEDSRVGQMWTGEQRTSISDHTRHKIGRLNELAKSRGQTLPQMAIAWILRRPEVTSALIGASTPEQIRENAGSLGNLGFSEAELGQIDQITAQ